MQMLNDVLFLLNESRQEELDKIVGDNKDYLSLIKEIESLLDNVDELEDEIINNKPLDYLLKEKIEKLDLLVQNIAYQQGVLDGLRLYNEINKLSNFALCPVCQGTGMREDKYCEFCKGKGKLNKEI